MKKLLGILVLGLLLTFSVNAKTKETLNFCVYQSAKSGFGYPVTKYNQNSICEGRDFLVTETSNKVLFDFLKNQYETRGGIFYIKPYNLAKLESNQTQEITKAEKKLKKLQKEKAELAKVETSSSKSLDDQKNIIEKSELVCIPVSERTAQQRAMDKFFKKADRLSKLDVDCLILKNLKTKKENKELAKLKKELKKLKKEKAELVKLKKELKKLKKENTELAKIKNTTRTDILNLERDEKYYALLIGNDDYKFWGKLEASVNDVKAVSNIISKKYGFETEVLINATSEEIENKLFEYTEKIKEQDNLLIYYAGHGDLNTNMSPPRAYWIPIDGGKKIDRKWINTQDVSAIVSLIKAKHILIMVDSCYSGSSMRGNVESSVTTNDQIKNTKYIEKLLRRKTRLLITSGGIEPVVDASVENHSLFAYKFLDILKENDGYITGSMVWSELNKYHGTANQNPEIRWLKEMGDLSGDFVFIAQN